jgi:iron complex transport system ATP-binding protein
MISCHRLTLATAQGNICENLSLDFVSGTVWGILGQNGVGKTTLLHALAGLIQPLAGEVLLDGRPTQELCTKVRAQKVGILLQQNEYRFPFQVRELVAQARFPYQTVWQFYRPDDKSIIDHALQSMNLSSLAHRPITTLSGGEQQRVRIACLLAQTPEIYLLDEPTAHLDIKIQIKVLKLLKSKTIQQSVSVIQVMHEPNLALQFCDKLLLMYPNGRTEAIDAQQLDSPRLSELYGVTFSAAKTEHDRYWLVH